MVGSGDALELGVEGVLDVCHENPLADAILMFVEWIGLKSPITPQTLLQFPVFRLLPTLRQIYRIDISRHMVADWSINSHQTHSDLFLPPF